MPYIDVDVDIDEFYEKCTKSEIQGLIELLEEDGFIIVKEKNNESVGFSEEKHDTHCDFLKENYHQLSLDDIAIIENIAKKYGSY
jgi:hypothetical protein